MPRLFVFACALLLSLYSMSYAHAESCDSDCHRQCNVKVLGASFVEPTCHAKCEIAKQAACAIGQPVPQIPLTPREQIEEGANLACGAVYHALVNGVIAECSNWDGRLDGQAELQRAKHILVAAGLFGPEEFDGVQIRVCPLRGAAGMAPDRGRIYIRPDQLNGDLVSLASLLGHEMVHIRQHRTSHANSFPCEYSRHYTACGGCQDRRHPMERQAYQWEDASRGQIVSATILNPPPGATQMPAQVCVIGNQAGQFCQMLVAMPRGYACQCNTPFGVFNGVTQ